MSYTILGKCGNCGGEVVLFDVWASTAPQRPTCQRCGAHAKPPQNVIDMDQPRTVRVFPPEFEQ